MNQMSKVSQEGSAKGGRDHRTAPRVPTFELQVGIATKHRLFVGLTSNISSGGIFVTTDEALECGDEIEVRFRIPGSDHVFHKRAQVAWTRPFDEFNAASQAQAGAGVRLIDLSDEERRMLNAFIDVHDPLFFDV